MGIIKPPPDVDTLPVTDAEKVGQKKGDIFVTTGIGYALEHATRPSTIAHALSSNPVALLAW